MHYLCTVMRKTVISILAMCVMVPSAAETAVDSIRIDEVVITGTRSQADARNLSQTVTVIGRDDIEENNRLSFISLLNEQVPGMFVTSRGMLGYGVSDGAAGNISMRGLSGSSAQMLVLIDGHPQYAGIFGHPLADMMQSAVAGRIEVLRGPASILYGSNAMGGVVNIVTRGSDADGSHTDIHLGAGSFGTVETQFGNTTRQGRLSSTVSGFYSRTDGHWDNMGFEQMGGYARLDCKISDRWSANASVDVTF